MEATPKDTLVRTAFYWSQVKSVSMGAMFGYELKVHGERGEKNDDNRLRRRRLILMLKSVGNEIA
jgi:hypothetical protein